ncbi:hypothetical protein PMAYCL1PPCAC_09048, partial [Pristionchus mayeri]
ESDAFIFVQMELCKYTLEEWLKKSENISRNIVRMKSWFKQIVSAVGYIHEQGYIHRDIKPSNILFSKTDHLKICNLGISTAFKVDNGEEIDATYSNIGTPLYQAPEQALQYNSKVDIFPLGLIFAELCITMTEDQR